MEVLAVRVVVAGVVPEVEGVVLVVPVAPVVRGVAVVEPAVVLRAVAVVLEGAIDVLRAGGDEAAEDPDSVDVRRALEVRVRFLVSSSDADTEAWERWVPIDEVLPAAALRAVDDTGGRVGGLVKPPVARVVEGVVLEALAAVPVVPAGRRTPVVPAVLVLGAVVLGLVVLVALVALLAAEGGDFGVAFGSAGASAAGSAAGSGADSTAGSAAGWAAGSAGGSADSAAGSATGSAAGSVAASGPGSAAGASAGASSRLTTSKLSSAMVTVIASLSLGCYAKSRKRVVRAWNRRTSVRCPQDTPRAKPRELQGQPRDDSRAVL